jgi:hypothetical protein
MYYHKLVFVGAELANGGAKDVSTKIEAQISDVRSFSTPQLQLPAFHLDPDRFLLLRLDNITRSTHLMLSQHSTETLHSSQSLIPIRTRQRVSSFDNRHTPLGRLCQHTMKKATTRRKEMVGTGSLFPFVRAYSDQLEDAGILQRVFIEFLDNLNATVIPNPEAQIANKAAGLAGWFV